MSVMVTVSKVRSRTGGRALKVGATDLVLRMIEAGMIMPDRMTDLMLSKTS
jgi:hypothetical protein